MDLLSKRYASPCFFLDGYIRTGRLSDFVTDLLQIEHEEAEERASWDFYLHKVFDGRTFADFKAEMKQDKDNRALSEKTIETTFKYSMDILNRFNPEERGD